MFIPLSPNNWAVAASAMNFHTHPADFASNVVNLLGAWKSHGFPLHSHLEVHMEGPQWGSHVWSTFVTLFSAPQRCEIRSVEAMLEGGLPRDPEEAPKSALRSASSTTTSIFSSQCEFKHRTGASPRTPEDQCCAVLPSSVHAKICKQHWPQGGCGGR